MKFLLALIAGTVLFCSILFIICIIKLLIDYFRDKPLGKTAILAFILFLAQNIFTFLYTYIEVGYLNTPIQESEIKISQPSISPYRKALNTIINSIDLIVQNYIHVNRFKKIFPENIEAKAHNLKTTTQQTAQTIVHSNNIPALNIKDYCAQIAAIADGSSVIELTCQKQEIESYNRLKKLDIPNNIMKTCSQILTFAESYVILEECIRQEVNARSQLQ